MCSIVDVHVESVFIQVVDKPFHSVNKKQSTTRSSWLLTADSIWKKYNKISTKTKKRATKPGKKSHRELERRKSVMDNLC